MSLTIKNFTRYVPQRKILKKVFATCQMRVPVLQGREISLVFIGDARMRTLNKTYRKKDSVTDVLSFEGVDEIFLNPRQAKRQNPCVSREVALLFTHGLLHLAHYDHNTKEKEKIMFRLQENIIKNCFDGV